MLATSNRSQSVITRIPRTPDYRYFNAEFADRFQANPVFFC